MLAKLLFDVPAELAEDCGALLVALGAGAVEEQATESGGRLVVYGEDAKALEALRDAAREAFGELGVTEADGSLVIHFEEHVESDWATAWTRYLEPELITERWAVVPFGKEAEIPEGIGCILIQPVLAFGDGAHATTRLAARAVELFCLTHPGARVLDIGTGTGVLAMLAARSGASRVVGTEVDPVALEAARENARLNALAGQIELVESKSPIVGPFDLVVANLPPRVLAEIAGEIAALALGARSLLLTGFLREQADEIGVLFASYGFVSASRAEEGDWALTVAHPRATPS